MADGKQSFQAVARPEEVAMMHGILEDHFGREALSPESRDEFAKRLLNLFATGVRDRGSLLAELAQLDTGP